MTAALRLLALLQSIGSTVALAAAVDALGTAAGQRDPLALVMAVCAAIVAAGGYLTAVLTYPSPTMEAP